jgi:hypothetical protein
MNQNPAPPSIWARLAFGIALVIVIEALFAGLMLSGHGWARAAHAMTAMLLFVAALITGLAALMARSRMDSGSLLGLNFLALAAAVAVQATLGVMFAHGVNVLWVHVPLGVALFGFAGRLIGSARGMIRL